MKSLIENQKSKIKNRIREWCEDMTHDARRSFVITLYAVMAGVCVGMTVCTICGINRNRRVLDVEHIKRLELIWGRKDSLNTDIKSYHYDNDSGE